MSYLFATPEWVAAAATDLASIGSSINAASAAAAMPTSAVMAAGADDVSALIAALFGAHAQAYQQLSAQAALFHDQFVQLMSAGANMYAGAEAANATPMQHGGTVSNEPAMMAAAQAASAGGTNRFNAAVGAASSGGSVFGARAATALAPASSAGLFGTGGGGAVGALGAQPGIAPACDGAVGEVGAAQAFAPGFFGGGAALGAASGQTAAQTAAQPAKGGNDAHPAGAPHVQHGDVGIVADSERGGWLHGEGAPVSARALDTADSFFAPAARDVGPGLFGHSGAGAGGVLGVAAPA